MPDLMAEIADISALLHGEHGGVVLVILFLGALFFMGSLMIIVLTLVRFFSFIFSLLKRVVYRNRDSVFRTGAGTGRKTHNAGRGSTAGRDNAGQ
ncbi:hypothetical protein P3133_000923 [Salmonella enterica]|nr:hypothetical protein [Salmonella enterica]